MPVTACPDKKFTAELPIGMYLGRDYNVNPKVCQTLDPSGGGGGGTGGWVGYGWVGGWVV